MLRERLTRLLQEAADDMTRLTGGAPLCDPTGARGPASRVKHAEGRWAALRGLQRRAGPDDDLRTHAEAERELWTQQLAELQRRGGGPGWVAYRAGGVEALDDLLSERTTSPPAPPAT